jgi:ATP-dependent Lhr-like helicase
LRKKFCRSFNLELQAAATEDGICIALAEQHSFPLGDVFYYLTNETVQHTLEQASLQSPIFGTRWRWDAMRSLALLRFMGGKKVPPYLQRLRSDDLLAAVFPTAAACQDNTPGDVQIPDHPLIGEVMKDVLTEAMDLQGLQEIIAKIKDGRIKGLAVDTTTPSQFAAEIVNSQVYTYLDDAGIEERRTRAVQMRRVLPSTESNEIGRLDPAAIDRIVERSWPDIQSADELHDLMLTVIAIPEESDVFAHSPKPLWDEYFLQLRTSGRATRMSLSGGHVYWVCAERFNIASRIWSDASFEDNFAKILPLFGTDAAAAEDRSISVLRAVRGWAGIIGPYLLSDLCTLLALPISDVEIACATLESEGAILRGQFTGRINLTREVKGVASAPLSSYEWCDRRMLAGIHKATLETLRKGVEPVSAGLFVRWLTRWQHVAPGTQLAGERGLLEVLRQLQGYEVAASAWETQVLSKRVKNYSPELLDKLCLKGAVGWGRLSMHPALAVADEPRTPDVNALKSTFLRHIEGAPAELVRGPGQLAKRRSKKVKVGEPMNVTAEPDGAGVIKRVLPSSVAPIAFFVRSDAEWLAALPKLPDLVDLTQLSTAAQIIEKFLRHRGASFFADIVQGTELERRQVQKGLWELVTAGMVSADGFDNLRSLIEVETPKRNGRKFKESGSGRWTLLHAPHSVPKSKGLMAMCQVLLNRYGVVFSDVVQREANLPPWRELLAVFRQMEDRGEVRSGRFVSGFLGEQFALAHAVDSLRAYKGHDDSNARVSINASDPLNLVGTILPGDKVSAASMKDVQLS